MNNALYLNDWTVTAVEATETAYKVTASYNIVPTVCPKCGCVGKLYKHGPKTVDYTDAPGAWAALHRGRPDQPHEVPGVRGHLHAGSNLSNFIAVLDDALATLEAAHD